MARGCSLCHQNVFSRGRCEGMCLFLFLKVLNSIKVFKEFGGIPDRSPYLSCVSWSLIPQMKWPHGKENTVLDLKHHRMELNPQMQREALLWRTKPKKILTLTFSRDAASVFQIIILDVLASLHWLRVHFRTDFKKLLFPFKHLNDLKTHLFSSVFGTIYIRHTYFHCSGFKSF